MTVAADYSYRIDELESVNKKLRAEAERLRALLLEGLGHVQAENAIAWRERVRAALDDKP